MWLHLEGKAGLGISPASRDQDVKGYVDSKIQPSKVAGWQDRRQASILKPSSLEQLQPCMKDLLMANFVHQRRLLAS